MARLHRRAIRFKFFHWVWIVASVTFITACPPKPMPPHSVMNRLTPADFPQFSDTGDYEPLIRSIAMSLSYLRKLPSERRMAYGPDEYTVAHLIDSLETFTRILRERPPVGRLNQTIRERFAVYQAAGNDADHQVLFTGYYEPILDGSRTRTPQYTVPIYGRPDDLMEIDLSPFAQDLKGRRIIAKQAGRTIVPYPDRSQIRQTDGFDRLARPLAWLRDEVDLFNLMIQGSGKVQLPDGSLLEIQFDVSNGRPFRSIGRLLIDEGKISRNRMSMQAIRDYLKQHPEEVDPVLNHNPRYIFFHQIPQGPMGALAVPLTPRRSIAVDRSIFPSAALAFISLPLPRVNEQGKITGWTPDAGFVLAQDTGSAIKGPGRVDLFWGHGLKAEVAAGHLKNNGQLYFLVLKSNNSVP